MAGPNIGIFLPTMTDPTTVPGDVVAAARHAEDLGFESVWVVDQLVAGTGNPMIESVVALSAAAGATERVRLGLGVMIVPLRPVAWVAKQVASLQQVSGGRVVFGVGVGGDRHERSWAAVGVPRAERGARTDAALQVLRGLIAGEACPVSDVDGTPLVRLAPGSAVPPILVGGGPAAIERVARYGDGWFAMPVPPQAAAPLIDQLRQRAEALDRPTPSITGSITAAIDGDTALPSPDELVRRMTDPDGMFGMPAEAVPDLLVTGTGSTVAQRVDGWSALGADRVVFTLVAGDWHRQATLLARILELG